jgi:IPT/TIG domain
MTRLSIVVVFSSLFVGVIDVGAQPAPPTITDFDPKKGPVGTPVRIMGTNFFPPATVVGFNQTPATIVSISSTQITTTVPPGATTGRTRADLNSASTIVSFGPELSHLAPENAHIERWEGIPAVDDGYEAARTAILARLRRLVPERGA